MPILYVSPTGSGKKNGSSVENAASVTQLGDMVKAAGAGGEVRMLADQGIYTIKKAINFYRGGSEDAPVTIRGTDAAGNDMDVKIVGGRATDWNSKKADGEELFRLNVNASDITFKNMDIANVGTAFRVGGDIKSLTIENVDATNVGRFLDDYASANGKTATISGLIVRDVNVEGFSKGVIRLQYDTHDVLIENVVGDSKHQDGDKFAIGIHLDGTAHDIVVRDSTMMNITDTTSGKYWNGDGFATERGVHDVLFENTVSSNNTDGGYDIKSTATTMVNAVADGNARNFRLWGEVTLINPTATDPHKYGGSGGQFQVQVLKDAAVKIVGGTIADSGNSTTVLMMDGGKLDLAKTVIQYAATADFTEGDPIFALTGVGTASITTHAETGKWSTDTSIAEIAAAARWLTKAVDIQAHRSTILADKMAGSAAADTFQFDMAAKTGADKIAGFGKNDVLATSQVLNDSNGDGLVTFKKDVLNLGGGDTVGITGLKQGLRYLGEDDSGHLYADASVRLKGMREGTTGNDKLAGDAVDAKADKFFFDTALGHVLGKDSVIDFGKRDIIVTTSKLGDDGLTATRGLFQLTDGIHALGSLAVSGTDDMTVRGLEFDGAKSIGGVQYYVYSMEGSSAGLADLAG